MAYVKTEWVKHQTLMSAEAMNHLEDGVEANDLAIGQMNEKLKIIDLAIEKIPDIDRGDLEVLASKDDLSEVASDMDNKITEAREEFSSGMDSVEESVETLGTRLDEVSASIGSVESEFDDALTRASSRMDDIQDQHDRDVRTIMDTCEGKVNTADHRRDMEAMEATLLASVSNMQESVDRAISRYNGTTIPVKSTQEVSDPVEGQLVMEPIIQMEETP